jgi:hypothetical protein
MSGPPKTVIKYSGLAVNAAGPLGAGVFGAPIRFRLPDEAGCKAAPGLLRMLKETAGADPERRLNELICRRADELPLPDGCVVVPPTSGHCIVWPDLLSALAVLTKCSDAIWLRSKAPCLLAGQQRRQVSLLVPPSFAARLPGASP